MTRHVSRYGRADTQPSQWKDYTVEAQLGDPVSMLELYRTALRLRRATRALREAPLRWLAAPDGVLAFACGPGFTCVVNLSTAPIDLPAHSAPALTSAPLDDDRLPVDAAAWLYR